MKRFFLFSLLFFPFSAFTLQPADIAVSADPAVKVQVTPRATNTSKTISITVNKQDHVHTVTGTSIYPLPVTDHHAGIAVSDPSTWPVPLPGVDTPMFYPDVNWPLPIPDVSNWEQGGAVRLFCNWSKMDFIDPLVYPGKKLTAHHHTFFGNTGIDENTTVDNIRSKGNASCRGGTINLSGYWVPSMIDTLHGNLPIAPKGLLIYYKTNNCEYNADCSGFVAGQSLALTNLVPIPHGLRMIAGDATRSTPGGVGSFSCLMPDKGFARPGTLGNNIPTNCEAGDQVWMNIPFPQCWDGKNLDSSDHKSHVAYMQNGAFVAGKQWHCPDGFPVVIPGLTFNVIFALPATPADTAGWRLSSDVYVGPAGYSAHGDYEFGWDPVFSDLWGTECLRKRRDCGSTDVGDGRITLEFQGN